MKSHKKMQSATSTDICPGVQSSHAPVVTAKPFIPKHSRHFLNCFLFDTQNQENGKDIGSGKKVIMQVYGISFPWTYIDHGISPEDLSPELKDPYL